MAEQRYVRVLPPVGLRAKVSFYSATAEDLAIHNGVLRSLLAAAPKPRRAEPAVLLKACRET